MMSVNKKDLLFSWLCGHFVLFSDAAVFLQTGVKVMVMSRSSRSGMSHNKTLLMRYDSQTLGNMYFNTDRGSKIYNSTRRKRLEQYWLLVNPEGGGGGCWVNTSIENLGSVYITEYLNYTWGAFDLFPPPKSKTTCITIRWKPFLQLWILTSVSQLNC